MQVKEGVPRPALQVCSAFSKSVTSAICRVSISWLQRLHLFEATSDGEASAMPTLQVWSAVMISLGSAVSHCVDELAATSHFGQIFFFGIRCMGLVLDDDKNVEFAHYFYGITHLIFGCLNITAENTYRYLTMLFCSVKSCFYHMIQKA
jgi:hypothetical protein